MAFSEQPSLRRSCRSPMASSFRAEARRIRSCSRGSFTSRRPSTTGEPLQKTAWGASSCSRSRNRAGQALSMPRTFPWQFPRCRASRATLSSVSLKLTRESPAGALTGNSRLTNRVPRPASSTRASIRSPGWTMSPLRYQMDTGSLTTSASRPASAMRAAALTLLCSNMEASVSRLYDSYDTMKARQTLRR